MPKLALWGLSHQPQQVLTFNAPWKEFRTEIRSEALCALGKASSTGLHIVRYFQEKMLWTQLGASSHTWKSTKIVNGDKCCLWRNSDLLRRCVLDCVTPLCLIGDVCWIVWPPSVSSYMLWPAPTPLQSSSSQLPERLSPGLSSSESPQIQPHSELLCCPFFQLTLSCFGLILLQVL